MKKVMFAILSIGLLASCAEHSEQNEPVAVQFNAVVVTKSRPSNWPLDAKVGIFMYANGTNTISENASNRKYAVSETGAFSPDSASQTIYYPMNDSKVDFIAYYPFTDTLSTSDLPVSVAVQTSQSAIDVMYAQRVSGNKKTDPNVNLVFVHKLSKFVLSVSAGTGLTTADLTGLTVSVKGYKTKATLSLLNGALSNVSTVADIVPYKYSDTHFEAILLPTDAVSGAKVEFKLAGGEIFTWDLSTISLSASTRAVYYVTLNRTGAVATGTITDWTSAPGADVSAE